MKCRLCGKDEKLINAHVIPRSFHRIDYSSKTPHRLLTNVKGRYSQTVRKGVYDATIVCEECERCFSKCDDYGQNLFLKSWEKFTVVHHLGECLGYSLPTFDYASLKLFFLSVLWRASASRHPMYAKVDLGPREAALKEAIKHSDPGDVNFFGVVLQAFDSRNVGILDPDLIRMGHLRYCRIYLAHVIAFIKVDSRPFPEPLSSMAIAPDRPLFLVNKHFMKSPEREIMRKLVLADRQRHKGTSYV